MTTRMAFLFALAACDGVVDETYRGDTKARLELVIASPPTTAMDIAAFVVWDGTYGSIYDDLRRTTLPDNTWLSHARLELVVHEPPPEELMDRGTVNGRIVVADLARVRDNLDGTFDVTDALVGTTDEIDASYKTVHTILQHQPFRVDGSGEIEHKRGYNLLRAHGEMVINCTAQAIATCVDYYKHTHPQLQLSVAEIEALCKSPRQDYGGFGSFERVPFSTQLPMVLTDQPMHVCTEATRCFYRKEDLPTCP